jgi:hypothetical protein
MKSPEMLSGNRKKIHLTKTRLIRQSLFARSIDTQINEMTHIWCDTLCGARLNYDILRLMFFGLEKEKEKEVKKI